MKNSKIMAKHPKRHFGLERLEGWVGTCHREIHWQLYHRTPLPLYELRPCPSYSRRRDHNNSVRNFDYVQDVVQPHKTWVCRHICHGHIFRVFAHFNPHGPAFGNICALYSPSLFECRRPLFFTCSISDCVDATMKGPSEKGDQFALLEYMKGGQMATHPCAPLPRIQVRHPQGVSMCNCSARCMIARRVSKPNICRLRILHCCCAQATPLSKLQWA